jgi:hypothetical protein
MDIIDDLLLDDLIVPGSDQDPYIVDWHGRYRGKGAPRDQRRARPRNHQSRPTCTGDRSV